MEETFVLKAEETFASVSDEQHEDEGIAWGF